MASSGSLPPAPWFPELTPENHAITSEASRLYNCVAWAAGDDRHWWWPSADPEDTEIYWPPTVPREETMAAFIAAFGTLGYLPCPEDLLEPGYEHVVLFTLDGKPTHAARQLTDGRWPSKLGRSVDIAHELNALDGPVYGTPTVFLRRPRA